MRRAALALTALAISFMLNACTSSGRPAPGRSTPNTATLTLTQTGPASAPTPAATSALNCADAIGAQAHPRPATTVLGVVDLPVSPETPALTTALTGNGNGPLRLFAKTALVIKPDARFELIVPAHFADRLSIGWGNPGMPSHRVTVDECGHQGGAWLGYPGGYWIDHPACVPIIVRVGDQQRTVHIGLGTACPGQQPPTQRNQTKREQAPPTIR